jgi:hypothetical protein
MQRQFLRGHENVAFHSGQYFAVAEFVAFTHSVAQGEYIVVFGHEALYYETDAPVAEKYVLAFALVISAVCPHYGLVEPFFECLDGLVIVKDGISV